MNTEIKVVSQDSRIYNAADATGFERGDMGKNKPKVKRIYSVFKIDPTNKLAHCQSWDSWGQLFNDVFPLHTLESYTKPTHK
jgi:hypothetical protein